VSRDDGFAIADVDTGLWSDPKVKALVRLQRDETRSLVTLALYHALILESWGAGERLSLDQAAPAWSTADLGPLTADLATVGLVDRRGKLPVESWSRWFGPARDRRETAREAGRKGNRSRWKSGTDRDPIAPAIPDRPSDRPTDRPPRARARARAEKPARAAAKTNGDPRPLSDILQAIDPTFEPPKRERS